MFSIEVGLTLVTTARYLLYDNASDSMNIIFMTRPADDSTSYSRIMNGNCEESQFSKDE